MFLINIFVFKNNCTIAKKSNYLVQQFYLEVVSKRPAAEHFKHGMMCGVATYIFKIIVFASNTNTSL